LVAHGCDDALGFPACDIDTERGILTDVQDVLECVLRNELFEEQRIFRDCREMLKISQQID
jgi:hypothetical protein